MRTCGMGMCFLGAVLLMAAGAAAQSPAEPTKAEMLEQMRAMEARIAELERRLDDQAGGMDDAASSDAAPSEAAIRSKGASQADPSVPIDGNALHVYWKDGLHLDSADGGVKLEIGGRAHLDWSWFNDGRDFDLVLGDVEDGVAFRRARLHLSGQLYDDFGFKFQFDFADGDANFMDVWLAYNNIPYLGTLKVGHFKEPFSLEEITSSNHISFLERALPNVFAPGRNTGLQLSNRHFGDRMTWAMGVFRDTDDFGNAMDDGGYNLTGRITALPWYAKEGARLLHLGASYSRRNPDDTLRFRQRPEADLAQPYVDTGTFQADAVDMYNAELAVVVDRLSLQGEYFWNEVGSELFGKVGLRGYYGQASVFLTPDRRNYSKSSGAFGNVKPSRNFVLRGPNRGPGAWELLARYSALDLSDGSILGGKEENWTLGLNWYLNPNVKFMWNYVHADIDRGVLYEDTIESLLMRIQIAL